MQHHEAKLLGLRSRFAIFMLLSIMLSASELSSAWTRDEQPRTVSMVGVHTGTTGFVTLTEGVHANCLYQHLYFDISGSLGKGMLATLMTAKSSGQRVRVGYSPPATSGTCMLELAALIP